jgi:phenylalanyl-tRNA synthetase beta chain
LFTDAVTRFNKGQSPLQNLAVASKIVNQIRDNAGGKVEVILDNNHLPDEVMQRGNIHPPVNVTAKFINDRLGWNLSSEEISNLLTNVEFKVELNGDQLAAIAPFWRTDIEIPEDIVEEVGRLQGYDKLPLDLPKRNLTPAAKNLLFEFKNQVSQLLSSAGANEVLTYNFIHGKLMDKTGQNRDMAFRLSNALSPDLQYFRISLTPSLLEKVHSNIKSGHGEFTLFEINKVHVKGINDDEGLPKEFARIALTLAADEKTAAASYAGAPYYQARKYLDLLLQRFGANNLEWKALSEADFGDHEAIRQMTMPFEPKRSAVIVSNGLIVGVVGEYRRAVQKALKLPAFAAGFEVFQSFLLDSDTSKNYTRLSRFPSVEQDICLKVPAETPYKAVYDFVSNHLDQSRPGQTHHSLSPVDIYQRQDDEQHKQITLRLKLASFDRTLTDEEVNKLLDSVAQAAQENLSAERI